MSAFTEHIQLEGLHAKDLQGTAATIKAYCCEHNSGCLRGECQHFFFFFYKHWNFQLSLKR